MGKTKQQQCQVMAMPCNDNSKQRHYQAAALPSSSASGNDSASSKTTTGSSSTMMKTIMRQSTCGVRDGNGIGDINSNTKGQQQCCQQGQSRKQQHIDAGLMTTALLALSIAIVMQ